MVQNPDAIAHDVGICYKNNFLDQVIVRLDFALGIEKFDTTLPKEIRNAAIGRFPIAEPTKSIGSQFTMTFNTPDQKQKSPKPLAVMNWVFHDDRKVKSLTINSASIVLVVSEYSRFDSMREDFLAITNEVFRLFPDSSSTRLGMRFINNIRLESEDDPLDWEKYLSPRHLVGLANIPEGALTRNLVTQEFRFPECNLKAQYGMPNPDYPAAIRRKEFLIDLDAHLSGSIEPLEVEPALTSFHARIQAYFESSITGEFRNLMNE